MPYKYSLYNEFHVRWIGHGKAHIEGRIYSMSISCVAPHAQGKSAKDRIFGASEAAQNRIKEIGADKVTNSTIGVMLDNDGNFVVLPTVAKVYHSLSDAELFRYAPITGLPEFLDLVQGACFVPSITASGTTRCLAIRCLQALGIGALTRPCAAI